MWSTVIPWEWSSSMILSWIKFQTRKWAWRVSIAGFMHVCERKRVVLLYHERGPRHGVAMLVESVGEAQLGDDPSVTVIVDYRSIEVENHRRRRHASAHLSHAQSTTFKMLKIINVNKNPKKRVFLSSKFSYLVQIHWKIFWNLNFWERNLDLISLPFKNISWN